MLSCYITGFQIPTAMPFSFKEIGILRLLYLACGGVYTSNDVPRRIKFVCCGFSAFLVLANVSCVTISSLRVRNSAEAIVLSLPFFYVLCVVTYITYCHRNGINMIFDCIEGKVLSLRNVYARNPFCNSRIRTFSKYDSSTDLVIQNPTQEVVRWYFLGYITFLPSIIIRPISGIFSNENKNFVRDVRYHFWPLPFIECISSVIVYLMIYTVETLFTLLFITLYFASPIFILTLAIQLYNMLVNYCLRIQNLVDFMNDHTNRDKTSLREADLLIFEKELILLVKQHQEFRK